MNPDSLPGGDAECRTGNGITGQMSRTVQCGLLGLLFHFLCDILYPHLVGNDHFNNILNMSLKLRFQISTLFAGEAPPAALNLNGRLRQAQHQATLNLFQRIKGQSIFVGPSTKTKPIFGGDVFMIL